MDQIDIIKGVERNYTISVEYHRCRAGRAAKAGGEGGWGSQAQAASGEADAGSSMYLVCVLTHTHTRTHTHHASSLAWPGLGGCCLRAPHATTVLLLRQHLGSTTTCVCRLCWRGWGIWQGAGGTGGLAWLACGMPACPPACGTSRKQAASASAPTHPMHTPSHHNPLPLTGTRSPRTLRPPWPGSRPVRLGSFSIKLPLRKGMRTTTAEGHRNLIFM